VEVLEDIRRGRDGQGIIAADKLEILEHESGGVSSAYFVHEAFLHKVVGSAAGGNGRFADRIG